MIELDETPVPPSESASVGNASEQAIAQEYTQDYTRSTLGFLADEERSGFGADEESFGFSMRPTAKAVSEPEARASAPDPSPSSIEVLPKPQFSFDDTDESAYSSTEAEMSANESARPEQISSQEISFQEKLPTATEVSSMQATKVVVQESAPEKPLSEAQQLADMLASAAVGISAVQEASNEAAFEEITENSHSEVNGSTPKVITIPSEAELAKEQQRLLRKQELLDYQHRKKEQLKAAEQAEHRSSGRMIGTIVMTTLIGAAITAGFFAWRNPTLRTATEEAWQKLTGKTTQTNTVQTAGNADSMPNPTLPVANTASGAGAMSQAASQTSGNTAASGNTVTPLDLTQAASGAENSKTVAAQDAPQTVVQDSARPSATTPVNTAPQPAVPSQTSSSARTNAADSAKRQHLITQTSVAQTASVQPLQANNKSASVESKKTAAKQIPPPTTGSAPEAKTNITGKNVPNNVAKVDAKQKTMPVKPTQQQTLAEAKSPKAAPQQGSTTTAKSDADAKSPQKKPTLSKPSSVEKLSAPYLNSGVFAIQVYASPSQADAEDWVERLRRRGFLNPSMSSQMVRGQVVYRVRFGLYNTLRDAERDAERYGFAGAWVVRLR